MRAFAVCQGDRQALALLRRRGDSVAEKLGFAGVSTIIATWVGVIGAGIGGWTAIDQQQKAIEAEQVQADKDYALQERQLNQDVKATYIETFKMFEIFNRTDQLAARERIYADAAADSTAGELKLNDIFVYFDFFDALQICVLSGTCDEYVASELFKPYAVDAWTKLKDDVAEYRKTDNPKFGLGVEWLAELQVAAPADADQVATPETSAPAPAP